MSSQAAAEVAKAGGALRTLIHQFADPLSFYRELVQNALDAGSLLVNITTDYDREKEIAHISIEDSGTGMTSHVIDTQLTRLFASKKDGDLTRIGKFGIGFVSVFALQPDRVTLETACDGEGWRVEFLDDGSFERHPLTDPREGTLIRLFKAMPFREYEKLRDDSRSTISYWCKHVGGEIVFNGEELNEPFTVDASVVLRWSEPDTEIVLGYPDDGASFTGFYNQGLTLAESRTEHTWPGLAIKANSRFLEHTLSRDSVVEDENFAKVRDRLMDMIETDFTTFVIARLTETTDRESHFQALLRHFAWQQLKTLGPEQLGHRTGESQNDSWQARPGHHKPGYLVDESLSFSDFPELPDEVVVTLSVPQDVQTPGETHLLSLLLIDEETNSTLGQKELTWGDFRPGYDLHQFSIPLAVTHTQTVIAKLDWTGLAPVNFHSLDLRRSVNRELTFTPAQQALQFFQTCSGSSVSIREVQEAHSHDRLWVMKESSKISELLEKDDHIVLQLERQSSEWEFLRLLLQREPAHAELELIAPIEESQPPCFEKLLPLVVDLARMWGLRVSELRWAYPDCNQEWFALRLPRLEGLHRLEESVQPQGQSGPHLIALNSRSELAHQILVLATKQPSLAAYLICKHLWAQTGISPKMDAKLALQAWELGRE